MNDDELDLLLDSARHNASPRTADRSRAVAHEIAARQHLKATTWRRWLRSSTLVPVGVGLVAVMGAGTYSAYQLSVPPFVTTEPGVERVTAPIALVYRTDAGTVVSCKLYLEFQDVTRLQRRGLNHLSTDPVWSRLGQRTYDALPARNRAAQDGPEPLWIGRIDARVNARALRAVPSLTFRGSSGTPRLVGSTTRCDYPQGQR